MDSEVRDYYPLRQGLIRHYRSESSAGLSVFKTEVLTVHSAGGRTKARVRHTVSAEDRPPKISEYDVLKDAGGVYRYKEKELHLPLEVGEKWDVPPAEYEINSFSKEVKVPAGVFKDCLQVLYLVSGGDAGGGEKCYAPGLGLVKHVSHDENDPFEIVLLRYSK